MTGKQRRPEPAAHGRAASTSKAAVVVAHPDDETLWAGGLILSHPERQWMIAALCRASDPDRAPKFRRVTKRLGAMGGMADLDDGPDQEPLDPSLIEATILELLPAGPWDLLVTHSPAGEYTRHRRHEETAAAVIRLWTSGRLPAKELWLFAYSDDERQRLPTAIADAHRRLTLPDGVWREKYALITEVYGFGKDGFEARTTPRLEAFWCFRQPAALRRWLDRQGQCA